MPEAKKYRDRYNDPNTVMRSVDGQRNRVYAGKRIENPDGSISYDQSDVRGRNGYGNNLRSLSARTGNRLRRANAIR